MKPRLMFTLLVPFLCWIFSLLGSFVAGFFGRFLGS